MYAGGSFVGASKPCGCKYCDDDSALSRDWTELLGLSPLGHKNAAEHQAKINEQYVLVKLLATSERDQNYSVGTQGT